MKSQFLLFFVALCLTVRAETQIVAHRGYWNTVGAAQNSIASLTKADSIGVFGSEFDVWLTADNELVINHDPKVNGITIAKAPYDTVKAIILANGERISTLDQYLNRAAALPDIRLVLELKPHNDDARELLAIKKIKKLLNKYKVYGRTDFISFSPYACRAAKHELPGIKIYYLNGDMSPQQVADEGWAGLDYRDVVYNNNPTWIDDAHRLGLEVNVWTVDKPDEIARFTDLGVDYITTNNPVKALELSSQGAQARRIINAVNNRWQSTHKPEATPFWHTAAYHTGNMEAYRLTGNPAWLAYSEAWAEHNDWQGAKGRDSSRWRHNYGETPDHVLFGDWQICFQTYADLYNILPDDRRIRRARQVMEYQMNTPDNDYWWWADGLYMVMPVMTKLYRITGNLLYLDKLYSYIQYSDSIMYDNEESLYYRDAKYTYPEHKTDKGVKDFWSRGNGWVHAGLAKVLQDLPADSKYRPYFEQRFRDMSSAVVRAQQPGGYWTRSLLDADQAPGYETSGTAFFTYALLWGINNGYLTDDIYRKAALDGWGYLRNIALQPDSTVGYVQPIGEKAIPGQIIDKSSTANFGVGAFLLAACEYVRFVEHNCLPDRVYWANLAYGIARPVLDNMSKGTLHANMEVEVSPNWDGRSKEVTYMETFGRLMAGIAPWLSLPDDDTAESVRRHELRDMALAGYANAVNPDSPDYLLWRGHGQALVDAAYIAESFLRGYEALWQPLDTVTKRRYIDEFSQLRRVDPPYTNWVLFSSVIESFLAKVGADYDQYRVNSAIRKVEEWYTGDGWYADGPEFAFDYYSSYVFHPMYLETLAAMKDAGAYTRIHYPRYYDRALKRAQKYSLVLERLVSPEGTFPVFGRSIPYRMAAMQPLALMAWYDKLPAGLTRGQVRNALTSVMHNMFDNKRNFNDGGFLTIGFVGRQPNIADWYTNNGSLYMTSLAFLPLGLPATHPFWTDAALPTTNQKAWNGTPFPKDHHWQDKEQIHDLF